MEVAIPYFIIPSHYLSVSAKGNESKTIRIASLPAEIQTLQPLKYDARVLSGTQQHSVLGTSKRK
jgi:hypothetical protein